ncbi:acid phosphatase type 7-like [Oppia nitens]|uniref:acid phosphatase type 7-like n=1 Tax=Oppia nitens TaxID=1686743 RepID=UPI0023DA5C7A|nr:acid phosphatase type 7-like [Oppia nitens]
MYSSRYDTHIIYSQPQQIHLSLGPSKSDIIVTWVTFNQTESSLVKFGNCQLDKWALPGSATLFTDSGPEKRQMYIHRVIINDLKPGVKYRYRCGSREGWSAIYAFTTLKNDSNWSPRIAVYGDLGNVLAESLGPLQEEAQQGMYDMIMHLGDFAYDLIDDNARVGDEFFRQIETMAAYVPYQACPGNHEYHYNFSNYNNRFSMMSESNNMINNNYWSYNIGPAHIIALSTEFYYYIKYNLGDGVSEMKAQYEWLENDLIEANKAENRQKRPWIITMAHRPPYSLFPDDNIRLGYKSSDGLRHYGLEELFYKYGSSIC